MIGKTVSHYRLTHQLGAGGMGVVYGAEDDRLGRQVALKFVPEDLLLDRQSVERFRVEARAASALNHPSICTVYDIGVHEGQPFIVMELMKGQTLHDRLNAGALKIGQVVDIGIDIADALDAAHTQGIVHRDIKPANIFLTERGHVKVMDFGLAKLLSNEDFAQTQEQIALTKPGVAMGTAAYMSPEQAAGDPVDRRSDLFSLGVVLYECATGRRPFVGNSARAVLSAILNTAPTAPGLLNEDLPSRLQQIISDCLEKDPDMRYQNAASLRADLKRVKRDLESGRVSSVTSVSDPRMASTPRSTPKSGQEAVTAIDSEPERTMPSTRANSRWSSRLGLVAIGSIVVIGAVLAAMGSFRPPQRDNATIATAADSAATALQSKLDSAEQRLQARQLRDAQRLADEALAASPGNARAITVRELAAAQLRDAEGALELARKMIAGGDVRGAVAALDRARMVDPAAPGLLEVSQLMADRFKAQAEAAERELQQSRAVSKPPQRAAASPAPSQAPASKNTSTLPPPVEAPRETSTAAAASSLPAAVAAPPTAAPPPARTEPSESAVIKPAPSPVSASDGRTPTQPAREADDDAAIRAVVAAYARAIESKDLALFRSIKPNLGAEEERRIQQGFRAVTTQKVDISITSIDRRGDRASVQLRRRDTIEAAGRRQSTESGQSMTLTKSKGGWVIVEIGR